MSSRVDLYSELNIEASASSEVIAQELQNELLSAAINGLTEEQVSLRRVAIDILGQPARRQAYDQALYNQPQADLSLQSLQMLADTDPQVLPQPAQAQPAAAPTPTYAPATTQQHVQYNYGAQPTASPATPTTSSLALKGDRRSDSITWIAITGFLALFLLVTTLLVDAGGLYIIVGIGGAIMAVNEVIWALRRYVSVNK